MTFGPDNRCAWRHAAWGGVTGDGDWVLLGSDVSGAAFAMQVRPAWGDTATPLVSLANAAAGSQGISASYTASYIDPETGATVPATIIRPQIDKTTLEAISWGQNDPTRPLQLVYDLHMTLPGGPVQELLFGSFTLNPGATI